MRRIEDVEIPNVLKSGWLAIKSRFSLSRKATKMVEAMKELRNHSKFDPVSHPALPAAMGSTPLGQTYELESRKRIEDGIIATLREKKFKIMGIYGMGGVGKTTLAKKIKNRVREEQIFDESVMVVVSQQVDMLKIQQEIAELLGLSLEIRSLSARAHRLRQRLMGTKRTLIILDDLWERLKLEDLGIPYESDVEGCTILLTSRNRDILTAMEVQDNIEIGILSESEAWSLFEEKVRTCVDDQSLRPIAQEVVKECKGLPIALVTVGGTLKDQRDKSIWEDALQQLKSCYPIDMPPFLKEVYNPLKLSYDLLDSPHAKRIFLLCCLFPEDYEIPIYHLFCYVWGLGMFERVRNLADARNRVYTLVKMLKNRSLLLEGRWDDHVKMHDVVRDVAIFIASAKEGLIDLNLSSKTWPREQSYSNCAWISSHDMAKERIELPKRLVFPKLRLLLIENSANKEFQIHDNFFEGTRELSVLSVSNYSLESLPQTTQLLKNLRTLSLDSCGSLRTISVLGELINLEILRCFHCNSIEELPVEIGGLDRLKLLSFVLCKKLQKIAPGLISNLASLEELRLMVSFGKWEAEDKAKERKNAALSELQSLSNLTCLMIDIDDSNLAAEQIHLSSNIVQFGVKIGAATRGWEPDSRGYERRMHLMLEREITITQESWIHQLLRCVEYLRLEGEGSSNLVLSEFLNLKSLRWERANMTSLKNTFFPLLEFLRLENLPNLEEIYNGAISEVSNPFENLKELRLSRLPAMKQLWKSSPSQNNVVSLFTNLSFIEIAECHNMRNLCSLAMANDSLLQLKSLEIRDCKMMEQVLLWNEEENEKNIGHRRHITFPKLDFLLLSNLPMLTTFCQGIESIKFPMLIDMEINLCPMMTSLVSTTASRSGGINRDGDDDDSFHLFCKPKVEFDRLKTLSMSGYKNMRGNNKLTLWCHQIPSDFFTRLEMLSIYQLGNIGSLFSFSIARNLVNLNYLHIGDCGEMVTVIEEEDCCGTERSLLLNLKWLTLASLPKLKAFCKWICALELPSLESVEITDCPEIERFSLGYSTTPNLESIYIDNQYIETEDLDGVLQQQHLSTRAEESTSGVEKQEQEE